MADVLRIAQSKSFSLYILDTRLPDGSGATLCRKLREFDPQTPVIVYSGAVFECERQEILDAGADAFIAKPEINRLMESVGSFLK